jgi:hypothetical protein
MATLICISLFYCLISIINGEKMYRIHGTHLGCYRDQPQRDLNGTMTGSDYMSVDKCIEYCFSNSYQYAGLQYGYLCMCGNSFGAYGRDNESCNIKCRLNNHKTCGGAWKNDIYRIVSYEIDVKLTTNYLGCFDDGDKRDLQGSFMENPDLTPEMCFKYCMSLNYNIIGLQYSFQCFCGNSYGNFGKLNETQCNTPCSGGSDKFCGGSWKNSIYIINSVSLQYDDTIEIGEQISPDVYQGIQFDNVDEIKTKSKLLNKDKIHMFNSKTDDQKQNNETTMKEVTAITKQPVSKFVFTKSSKLLTKLSAPTTTTTTTTKAVITTTTTTITTTVSTTATTTRTTTTTITTTEPSTTTTITAPIKTTVPHPALTTFIYKLQHKTTAESLSPDPFPFAVPISFEEYQKQQKYLQEQQLKLQKQFEAQKLYQEKHHLPLN